MLLSTYDGYYSLNEIFVNKEPKKVKIVELKSDNSEQTILEKTLIDPDVLKKGKKHYDNGIQSTGFNNPNLGFVDIVSYIDKNNNGKFDKEDIKVDNVPIKCNWMNEDVYTNKRGQVSPSGIDSGIYYIKIDNDKLAATLVDYENKTKIVRVEGGKTTRVEFPLKSCAGNISGRVSITDDFDRHLDTKDFVVVLLDSNGEEKAYSTLDNNGKFYLSGIEPGIYFVQLDKNIIEENNLQNVENKSIIKIEITYEYKHFTDIKDINLVYSIVSI